MYIGNIFPWQKLLRSVEVFLLVGLVIVCFLLVEVGLVIVCEYNSFVVRLYKIGMV